MRAVYHRVRAPGNKFDASALNAGMPDMAPSGSGASTTGRSMSRLASVTSAAGGPATGRRLHKMVSGVRRAPPVAAPKPSLLNEQLRTRFLLEDDVAVPGAAGRVTYTSPWCRPFKIAASNQKQDVMIEGASVRRQSSM